jgi:hypothetical protein
VGSARHRTRPEDVMDSFVMSGHLSVGDRWQIISLRLDPDNPGMTPNQIASIINCTRRTVFNILRLFHETNNVIEREGRGRTLLSNRKRIHDTIIMHRMIENFMRYRMAEVLFYNLFLWNNN